MGQAFVPGELRGYFNDLAAKTRWSGKCDQQGIPLVKLADRRTACFATTIAQKALGHWDRCQLHGAPLDRDEFLKIAGWLLARQDARGGWPVWADLGLALCSPCNAMTQGQCISVFVRAHSTIGDPSYAEASRRALDLMRKSVSEGGVAAIEGADVYLEEVPDDTRTSILNGWIFALFGLYDMQIGLGDPYAAELLSTSMETVRKSLADYDSAYWSYYDARGSLASCFYHDLHIAQLKALGEVDNRCPVWEETVDRWTGYGNCCLCRWRASVVKTAQKLRNPGKVIVMS